MATRRAPNNRSRPRCSQCRRSVAASARRRLLIEAALGYKIVTVRADYDFHPDESTVRVFTTPASGVLQLDDDVAITEAVTSGVVLRHYAFGDRWFKINVTTDQQGELVETGAPQQRFAFNCDIATPMERDGNATFAVDLFVDVLVRADLRSIHVGDQDEFEQALSVGLISHAEGEQARRGVAELLERVKAGTLLPWLDELCPFGPTEPPEAPPMRWEEVPRRLLPQIRRTW